MPRSFLGYYCSSSANSTIVTAIVCCRCHRRRCRCCCCCCRCHSHRLFYSTLISNYALLFSQKKIKETFSFFFSFIIFFQFLPFLFFLFPLFTIEICEFFVPPNISNQLNYNCNSSVPRSQQLDIKTEMKNIRNFLFKHLDLNKKKKKLF